MRKTLYRMREGRIIAGVCAGIGEYFNVDVNLVRIAAVLFGCTGTGIAAYIVAAVLLPEA